MKKDNQIKKKQEVSEESDDETDEELPHKVNRGRIPFGIRLDGRRARVRY